MKKVFPLFCTFFLIIVTFTVVCIFFTEKTDVLGLEKIKPSVTFHEKNGTMHITWENLPYPCFYSVETFCPTTGMIPGEPKARLIDSKITFTNSCEIKTTAIPMFYKISAYGIFGKLDSPFVPVDHPYYTSPLSPVHVFHYTHDNKASIRPYLVWHAVPRAVCYEVEVLSSPPENERGTQLSKKYRLVSTSKVYTNGWQADLKDYADEPSLYWRVRALDLNRQPIGVFSKAEPLVIDKKAPIPNKPLLNTFDKMPNNKQILYPTYHWIPMHNVFTYEVELLNAPPLTENNTESSEHRIWHKLSNDTFSCYDEEARSNPGEYYWRVRGIDEEGNTIGVYSDTAHYSIKTQKNRILAASFGDSITHGGGSISYPPSSREYDYTTYLDFETINLGKSGDTTASSLERFDDDVLPFKPRNLLIMTGANDIRIDRPVNEMIQDLEKIKEKCLHNDIRPIFLTLMPINPTNIKKAFNSETNPEWHSRLTKLNEYIRAQEYRIDLEPYFYDSTNSFMNPSLAIDGLHPDINGKKLMAEIINAHQNLLAK